MKNRYIQIFSCLIALLSFATFPACEVDDKINFVTEGGINDVDTGYVSLIDITDNTDADWNTLPAKYVVSATHTKGCSMDGLKSVKVYCDQKYLNILVEVNLEIVTDLGCTPFHIFLNVDGSAATGGYGDIFADADIDLMLETAVYQSGKVAYNPAVFKWWGDVGENGWLWTDPKNPGTAENGWGAVIPEGSSPAVGYAQQVNGDLSKIEIQIVKERVPAQWANEFTIGFDIQQNWTSVGVLPNAADDPITGARVRANKLKVKVNTSESSTDTPKENIPDTIGWNIPAEAITVAQAREICMGLESGEKTDTKYYVMGYVKKIHSKHADGVTNYGNAQFYMEDVKGANSVDDFMAYQVYGVNNQKISDPNAVLVGDFVVVYGQLTNYMGTFETTGQGSAYIWKSTNPLFNDSQEPEILEIPVVVTSAITQITENSAVAGGNVTSDGGASVIERGVVYSANPNPVITNLNNTIRPCGSGIGDFTYTITGLQPNTTYYVRAYAKNDVGTAYGEEVSFTTKEVSVSDPTGTENGYGYVDLGLSVKWATMNVGASKPEDYGDYFAWGETSTKSTYSWSTYKWCNGSSSTLTKYNNSSSYGTVDNKTQLDLSDDAARANWGGPWRMPTDAELTELREQCTWSWTTQNGVNGYKVTSKSNGNSIFLPAAGNRSGSSLGSAGSIGHYWSSSLITDYPYGAWYVDFNSSYVYRSYYSRYHGLSVRPVLGENEVEITTPTVTTTTVTQITETTAVAGGNVTSDGGASVSERGVVYSTNPNPVITNLNNTIRPCGSGIGEFTYTITGLQSGTKYYIRAYAKNDVGTAYGEEMSFTTKVQPTPEYIDLGLSVKWATFNVGASKPEDYGSYFAWGEVEPKEVYNMSTYKWCNGSETTLTKYNTKSSNGTVDNKTQLDLSDDAARANWGGAWRMPTDAEWRELCGQCTWTWTTQNGVNGYKVTSKKSGYTNNSIFLPATGYRNFSSLNNAGSSGYYWSSSLITNTPHCSWGALLRSSDVLSGYYGYRSEGLSVRAVHQ